MLGTALNIGGILIGGLSGLTGGNLSPANQHRARLLLTGLTLLVGLAVLWSGLPPTVSATARQLVIAVAALCLGSLTGHLLGLQTTLGRWVKWAAPKASAAGPAGPNPSARTEFPLEALVLAVNPLGLVGAVLEGWTGDWRPLALKGALDALAALGFAAAGSRTVLLTILPVAALQGTLTLAAGALAVRFPDPALAGSLRVIAGFIVLSATPVILGLRRVPLANYLPALFYAPLLAAWWR